MKYRKRPVVIDAEQHHGASFVLPTLEGDMWVSDGDWIITGVKGERYPCKPDIFALTYEAVAAPPPKGGHCIACGYCKCGK